MKGISAAYMGLLFAQEKVTGMETYLIVVDTDLAAVSYTSRRDSCRGITMNLDEALRKAATLARDESNTTVGVMTLSGEVVATAYAWDMVRKVFYTCPFVTDGGQNVAVRPHRTAGMYLYTPDNNRHFYAEDEEFPGELVEFFKPELHTDRYMESILTVHA